MCTHFKRTLLSSLLLLSPLSLFASDGDIPLDTLSATAVPCFKEALPITSFDKDTSFTPKLLPSTQPSCVHDEYVDVPLDDEKTPQPLGKKFSLFDPSTW